MAVPLDKDLYKKAKAKADDVYGKKTSGFKSGFLVQEYKRLGGRYSNGKEPKGNLRNWFKERWMNVNPDEDGYPVFRPTKRINKKTPLLASEIDPKNLKEQIKLKEKIKGSKNLPPFKPKKTN